eukprot:CAMPEP_0119014584 /NCGR_PEP_ID=MMETSP1176-20130426/9993_1 /TAXON_ID=265551 /ORGANISM="Synedropsis recta cf, Strain CCMP1620" /LENGTH=303 /DNA_ID=CAMNT_0006967787 /DNA_START=89 /DNA_END=1000 /DNA_ORIENTATION=-
MNMTIFDSMALEDVAPTIRAMRQQEDNGYACQDYFHQDEPLTRVHSKGPLNSADPVDAECRFRMVEWCYQVVDFCKFNRETVAIAMSFLDRFMTTPEGTGVLENRKIFQLCTMTCLYTAIKTHEPEAMDPQVISGLSRGAYSAKQVEAMERRILGAIKWRMNPPTSLSFVRSFISLMPGVGMGKDLRKSAFEMAKYQAELAVEEYSFVNVNSSMIAFAALANALQSVDAERKDEYFKRVSCAAGIDTTSKAFIECRQSLWSAMNDEPQSQLNQLAPEPPTVTKTTGSSSGVHQSPRGVIVMET